MNLQIKKLLLKLKNDGHLIIIASHIKEDINELSDEILMFDDCRIKNVIIS